MLLLEATHRMTQNDHLVLTDVYLSLQDAMADTTFTPIDQDYDGV